MNDDIETIAVLGMNSEDRLVISTHLDLDLLEEFLQDCLDIVREKSFKEDFTLQ